MKDIKKLLVISVVLVLAVIGAFGTNASIESGATQPDKIKKTDIDISKEEISRDEPDEATVVGAIDLSGVKYYIVDMGVAQTGESPLLVYCREEDFVATWYQEKKFVFELQKKDLLVIYKANLIGDAALP